MGETDILRIVSIVEGRCYVDGSIWLAVGVITLVIALLIQSVKKDALYRINAMVDTLPGAHDVRRLLEDMKETGDVRGRVICDEPKNTHMAWIMPPPELPLTKRIKKRFRGRIRRLANHLL